MKLAPDSTGTVNILLVEDNPADAKFVAEILPQINFKLTHASSLTEAQQMINSNDISLILLDLTLPDSTGFRTFTTMSNAARKTPIIILTGLDNDTFALEAVRSGAQDYITKNTIDAKLLQRSIGYAIERKEVEEKLRDAAQRDRETEGNLKLALSASAIGVWSWDIKKDIVLRDEQCLSIFGLNHSDQSFNLKSFINLVHPDDVESVSKAIQDAVKICGEYIVDFRVIKDDGSICYISARGRVLADDTGNPTKLIGVSLDITRQKLEIKTDKRLAILEQHEDFMATLTHDLKSPLIGANRMLTMLAEKQFGNLTDEQKHLMIQLRDSNESLLELVQNLIEVYRYEKDVSSVEFREIEICKLINKAIDSASLFAREKEIVIQSRYSDSPIYISGHDNSLLRVLQNLLDNAIKFSPRGGTIIVSLRKFLGNAEVEVIDSGPGISSEDRSQLFQKFRQGDGGKKYNPGSGLGLYLCKQIIDAHHGEISCRSDDENNGAAFIFKLPMHAGIAE